MLTLRSDQVIERDQDHYLQIGDNQLLLPPPLAALLQQLPLPRSNNRSVLPSPDSSAPLLFPGFITRSHSTVERSAHASSAMASPRTPVETPRR